MQQVSNVSLIALHRPLRTHMTFIILKDTSSKWKRESMHSHAKQKAWIEMIKKRHLYSLSLYLMVTLCHFTIYYRQSSDEFFRFRFLAHCRRVCRAAAAPLPYIYITTYNVTAIHQQNIFRIFSYLNHKRDAIILITLIVAMLLLVLYCLEESS